MRLPQTMAVVVPMTLLALCHGGCLGELNTNSNMIWVPDNGDGTYKTPIIFADY